MATTSVAEAVSEETSPRERAVSTAEDMTQGTSADFDEEEGEFIRAEMERAINGLDKSPESDGRPP